MTMRYLRLREGGPAVPIELSRSELMAMRGLDLVTISPGANDRVWDVRAARKVGVARIGDLQITVSSKIPINRLVFLLGFSDAGLWTKDEVDLDSDAELLPAMAEAFSRLAQRAIEQGLLQGYRGTDDCLPVLRGRLRESEQLRRRYGRLMPLEVSYDEFTQDVPENQLLLAATDRLLRVADISRTSRRRLAGLRLDLANVTLLGRKAPVPHWWPSRLNARYQPALHLAQVVLSCDSFEHRIGDLTVAGFTVDVWRAYEDFLTKSLAFELETVDGRARRQDQRALDVDQRVVIRPDLVWYRSGQPSAVIDAKYKAERPDGFPDADLYQLLAYCTALGLTEGHLVYARGGGTPVSHRIRGTGITIHCHTVDLEADPARLRTEVRLLAATIVELSTERTEEVGFTPMV